MPRGDGLGFVSPNYDDLFRTLRGDLANKDPIELKPPYKVVRAKPEEMEVPHHPVGVLTFKFRMPGERFSIEQVARSAYMKWAIVGALTETISRICKVKIRPDAILPCVDEVEVIDVQMPYMGEHLWQFCEVRFDYKVKIENPVLAKRASEIAFERMVDFEADFCKALETRFREVYLLTILGLTNKRYLLMDGQTISDQLNLFQASMEGDLSTLSEMINRGVDLNAVQKAVRFPANILDEDFYFVCVTLGRTALLAAAEEGHVEALQLLLEAKADVNAQDASGFHALYLAAGAPKLAEEAVTLLLAHNADVNLRNNSGYTPLHNACGCGNVGGIRALLKARGDLNAKSNGGAAPVHVAVINDQPLALEVLKEARANLDMPAFGGNTPVHEGVMQNNADIIQKLFSLGANINIESGPENDYATPLKMANDRKKKKAAKKLKDLKALEKILWEDGVDPESARGAGRSLPA